MASSLPPSPVMSTAVSTVDFPRCRTQAEARTVPVAWLRRKWSALVCVTYYRPSLWAAAPVALSARVEMAPP